MLEGVIGQRFLRREVMIGAVGKRLDVEAEAGALRGGLEHRQRRADDLGADAVTGDGRDAITLHPSPVTFCPHAMQNCQPTSSSLPQVGQWTTPMFWPQCGQKSTVRPTGRPAPQ